MVEDEAAEGIRLQRVLATAGIGSRRACEELIEQGRVTVDGQVVRVQGMRVHPETAVITVDGARVVTKADSVYVALNKPRGMLSAMSDPEGRPHVGQLVEDRAQRLFHVGRLDGESEGLLLLMNDGDLAHRLTHPSYGVEKTYIVEVSAPVSRSTLRRLRSGVELEDGVVELHGLRVLHVINGRAQVELTIHEGRKHVVRRLMEEVGHPVHRLVRTRIGPVHLGSLKSGRLRRLTSVEVAELHKIAQL